MIKRDCVCVMLGEREIQREGEREIQREGKTQRKSFQKYIIIKGCGSLLVFQYNQFPLYSVPLILVSY